MSTGTKKDGGGAVAPDKQQSDLQMLWSDKPSDSVVIYRSKRWATHKVLLASKSGWFRKKLLEDPQYDATGKRMIEVAEHSPGSPHSVIEFIYGTGHLNKLENQEPSNQKSVQFITVCVHAYRAGLEFDHCDMAGYAVDCLEKTLSTQLKEICVFPFHRAKEAFDPCKACGLWHGIRNADQIKKYGEDRDLPYRMLVDFVVAGREVILRDQFFQGYTKNDDFSAEFLKQVTRTQYQGRYQTEWMESAAVKPETLPNRLVKCAVCGLNVNLKGGEPAHYSPLLPEPLMSVYTKVCCSDCAADPKNQDVDGRISWSVFKQTEDNDYWDGDALVFGTSRD